MSRSYMLVTLGSVRIFGLWLPGFAVILRSKAFFFCVFLLSDRTKNPTNEFTHNRQTPFFTHNRYLYSDRIPGSLAFRLPIPGSLAFRLRFRFLGFLALSLPVTFLPCSFPGFEIFVRGVSRSTELLPNHREGF